MKITIACNNLQCPNADGFMETAAPSNIVSYTTNQRCHNEAVPKVRLSDLLQSAKLNEHFISTQFNWCWTQGLHWKATRVKRIFRPARHRLEPIGTPWLLPVPYWEPPVAYHTNTSNAFDNSSHNILYTYNPMLSESTDTKKNLQISQMRKVKPVNFGHVFSCSCWRATPPQTLQI